MLLRTLAPDEWHLPTVSSQRTVKDIASHLLDGSLRRLSIQRDGYQSPNAGTAEAEPLAAYLARLNHEWEVAAQRLSPRVLVDLIEWADAQLAELFASLDPDGPAIFPVSWAGQEQSANWMDVARDYTEKWHHTQQIFAATGRHSTILNQRLGRPCFDIFMRAAPFTYRETKAPTGSVVSILITGEAGGAWHMEKASDGWRQTPAPAREPAAAFTTDGDTFWKLVTKRRRPEAARQQFGAAITITGDPRLAAPMFNMVSVVA